MAVTSAQPHRRITVALEQSPYDVVIGDGSLEDLGRQLLDAGVRPGRRILVVSNADVAGPYGEICLQALTKAGFEAELLVIEAGEDQKTPATVALIHDAAFRQKLERSALMLALGGGVVGDMTGSRPQPGCVASGLFRFQRPCWRWWMRPSAGKPVSTIQEGKPDRAFHQPTCAD